MSTDPSPLAVSAGIGAPGPPASAGSEGGVTAAGSPVAVDRGAPCLDEDTWCRWWRDLIVERYRFDRFDAFVPLPTADCPWELRVALGRVVEQSMAEVSGPSMTTQLVIEALDVA